MLRQLLVPVMLGRPEVDAARYACDLALSQQGAVDVLVGMSAVSPMVAGWDYFPAGMYDTLDETTKAAAETLAGEMRRALADRQATHAVRVAGAFWMTPPEQALAYARTCDAVVLGRADKPTDPDDRLFAALLLGAGRPVIVVPPGGGRVPHRILVSWKPTREATRAVHDALPLLKAARQVEVVTVMGPLEEQPREDPFEQTLLNHLQAHGVAATRERVQRHDRSTGQAVLDHARASGADLLVAGGYGHARAVQQVFGGTTRRLYRHAPLPVLFSH